MCAVRNYFEKRAGRQFPKIVSNRFSTTENFPPRYWMRSRYEPLDASGFVIPKLSSAGKIVRQPINQVCEIDALSATTSSFSKLNIFCSSFHQLSTLNPQPSSLIASRG